MFFFTYYSYWLLCANTWFEIDWYTTNFFFPLSLFSLNSSTCWLKIVSLFFFFFSFFRKIYVLRVACTPATLSRTYMVYMFIKENVRPTVTILKNTSSSTIVINRLERMRGTRKKKYICEDEREDFSFICVYDSWDHPVGRLLDRPWSWSIEWRRLLTWYNAA